MACAPCAARAAQRAAAAQRMYAPADLVDPADAEIATRVDGTPIDEDAPVMVDGGVGPLSWWQWTLSMSPTVAPPRWPAEYATVHRGQLFAAQGDPQRVASSMRTRARKVDV